MKFVFVFFILLSSLSLAKTSIRLENEYKLSLPNDRADEVWGYLFKNYAYFKDSPFETVFSEELFTDIYFDDDQYSFLRNKNGLRRRMRTIPATPEAPKNGRSLIQIKLKREQDVVTNRNEIKFEIKDKLQGASFDTPPYFLIIDKEKMDFLDILKKLRVKKENLFVSLILNQRRRRVYIGLRGHPFATISLDEVSSRKWWVEEKIVELEIELSEIRYTRASFAEREEMQSISDKIRKDLVSNLTYLKLDPEPKYNKMFDQMVKTMPFYKVIVHLESWFQ